VRELKLTITCTTAVTAATVLPQMSGNGLLLYDSDGEDTASPLSTSKPGSPTTGNSNKQVTNTTNNSNNTGTITAWDPNDSESLGAFAAFGGATTTGAATAANNNTSNNSSAWDTSDAHVSGLFSGATTTGNKSNSTGAWSVTGTPAFAPAAATASNGFSGNGFSSNGFDAWSPQQTQQSPVFGANNTTNSSAAWSIPSAVQMNNASISIPPPAVPQNGGWAPTSPPGAPLFAVSPPSTAAGAADPFNPFDDMFGAGAGSGASSSNKPVQHSTAGWD
jgi:hypothetical protein